MIGSSVMLSPIFRIFCDTDASTAAPNGNMRSMVRHFASPARWYETSHVPATVKRPPKYTTKPGRSWNRTKAIATEKNGEVPRIGPARETPSRKIGRASCRERVQVEVGEVGLES